MPRIAVKHPSGLHLIFSTVVDDFMPGAYTTDQLPQAVAEMDRAFIPVYKPSFFDPGIRDDPAAWERYYSTCVMAHGWKHAESRVGGIITSVNRD